MLLTSHAASLPAECSRLLQGSTRKKHRWRFQGFLLIANVCGIGSTKASKFRVILLLHVAVPTFSIASCSQLTPSSGPTSVRSTASSAASLPTLWFLTTVQRNLELTRSFELIQRGHSPGGGPGTSQFLWVNLKEPSQSTLTKLHTTANGAFSVQGLWTHILLTVMAAVWLHFGQASNGLLHLRAMVIFFLKSILAGAPQLPSLVT